jgi:hypothetical protein
MTRPRVVHTVSRMTTEHAIHRVEVSFVGAPPARPIGWASGVSEVEVDGPTVRCLVTGSFQPFLEALRGYEVNSLWSIPAANARSSQRPGGSL